MRNRFLEFGQVLRPIGRHLLGKNGCTGHQQVPLGPKDIQGAVPRQDEQIVLEGQIFIQPVPVQPHFHEYHLGKVFRQGIVLDEGLHEPMDLGIIPEEDGVKGTAVSLLDESNQLTVRELIVCLLGLQGKTEYLERPTAAATNRAWNSRKRAVPPPRRWKHRRCRPGRCTGGRPGGRTRAGR